MDSDALQVLAEVFGYSGFRGDQQKIIEHLVHDGEALVLMPTGGGKSLCYQVPAIMRHRAGRGTSIVISPLIALMHDQVGALNVAGVTAAFLNSSQSADESRQVEQQLLTGIPVLVYVAPERLTTPRFLAILAALHERKQLSLFAIDEAHCVSQWGHDFRPDYRALSLLAERFPGVPRIALTATADTITRLDIIERLHLENAQLFVSSFDRPNIHYRVAEKTETRQQLLRFIRSEHLGEAGIVYCQSRKKVEDTAAWLAQAGINALPYHAGLDSSTRTTHHQRFLRDEGIVMVATIAFGMGIDKPNVRFVAHLDLPKNIESYYQETGRAGRDGEPANAWMTYGLQDVIQQRRMIDASPADENFKQLLRAKLEALLALAEATDCRRTRLLHYFDEVSTACHNCDNCLQPPALWDATTAAQHILSTLYRIKQHSGIHFGAGHVIDVVRGKLNDKITHFGHQHLSTFGIGAKLPDNEWRRILRQLIATGLIRLDMQNFNTLQLTEAARPVLRGERSVFMRAQEKTSKPTPRANKTSAQQHPLMDKLKAWRLDIATKNNLPAYIILHDSTLMALVEQQPQSKLALSQVSGIGVKKLEAYGDSLLALLQAG